MSVEADALDLVGLIYNAVGQPALWNTFLERFATAVDGAATSLIMYNPVDRLGGLVACVRTDPEEQRRYAQYYVGIDSFGVHGAHLLQPGTVQSGQALCAEPTLVRGEFYNDFLRPINLHHQFLGTIDRDGTQVSFLASLRSKSAGPFDESQQRLLALLLPHLRRAMTLHTHLRGIEASCQWHAEVLDRLPIGVAMIGTRGGVLSLNARARAVLARNDGLQCGLGGLRASLSHESRRLHTLILHAVNTGLGLGLSAGGVVNISRLSGARAYQLVISPYHRAQAPSVIDAPAATVFIFDPDARIPELREGLAQLYGLTDAESQLAALLAQGWSLAEAADQLNVTRNTLRTHLKSVFAKVGVHRQAELLHRIYSGPAIMGSG